MSNAVRRRAMALLCGMRLYRFTLAGAAPREFDKNLAIRWPGDAKRGTALLADEFHLAGETLRLSPPYAAPAQASADFLAEFHSFTWLADLATLGSAEAPEIGRTPIATWIPAGPCAARIASCRMRCRWRSTAWRRCCACSARAMGGSPSSTTPPRNTAPSPTSC